jgi:hypothetical protein
MTRLGSLKSVTNFTVWVTIVVQLIGLLPLSQNSVSAAIEKLPESELKALDEYPQWVADMCGPGSKPATIDPAPASANQSVFLLGDSIAKQAATAYETTFKQSGFELSVDASSSRGLKIKGVDGNKLTGLEAIKKSDALRKASKIIIALGSNGGATEETINEAIDTIRERNAGATIYWIDTISVGRSDNYNRQVIGPANQVIRAQAAIKDYQVISWFKTVDPGGDPDNPTKSEQDLNKYIDNSDGLGVHLTSAGVTALTKAVIETVATQAAQSTQFTEGDQVVCCSTGSSDETVSLPGDGRTEQAFRFFVEQKGLSKEQAAGVVGNMVVESGVNPENIQNPAGDTKDPSNLTGQTQGWGIIQWTPGAKIIGIAKAQGVTSPIYELSTQLQIVWNHMTGTSPTGVRNMVERYKKINDVGEAAVAFEELMEGAGVEVHAKRKAAARAVLAKYGSDVQANTSTQAATVQSNANAVNPEQCCPPASGNDNISDGSPSDWKKMYTGSNASKVATMSHGDLQKPKILVIHYTVGPQEGEDLLNFFAGTAEHTGIQFNVGKSGKIYQYYPLNDMKKTYHVGNANDKSIGIEITGRDVNELLDNKDQFESVVSLARFLCDHYDIPCSEPKGDITGDGLEVAQGMLGHDETPTNDHVDPDAEYNKSVNRNDSSKHPYMVKLRTAMGFNPTPGKSGEKAAPTESGDTTQCGAGSAAADSDTGNGTAKDPVGAGPNRGLALEAVQYDTKASNDKYTYQWGGLHGSVSQLEKFARSGGVTDCSGFIRYIIWRIYGEDVGSFATQTLPTLDNFKEIAAGEVAAGDIGWNEGHVDFITKNNGGGKLHQFGAHSTENDLYGGDIPASQYTKYFRYTGPKNIVGQKGD